MKHRKLQVATAIITAICIVFIFCSCQTDKCEFSSFAMGSAVTADIYGIDRENGATLWNEICTAVSSSDKLLSSTDPSSDISRINKNGLAIVDPYTVQFMQKAVLLCNTLGRRIDITLGAATELWGFTSDSPSVPDPSKLKEAVETAELDNLLIEEASNRISVKKGQKLDLGALGKGEACDIIKEKITAKGLSACVSFGGNILVAGKKPFAKNGAWKIGIRNPFGNTLDTFAYLTVDASSNAKCISTSGSYEKRFEKDNKAYHHILDPKTGLPVMNGLASVSIISTSGLNADALSTAAFVNGLNGDTLSWLKAFRADAIFVFEDGRVFMTDGLSKIFTITDKDGFRIVSYEEATK